MKVAIVYIISCGLKPQKHKGSPYASSSHGYTCQYHELSHKVACRLAPRRKYYCCARNIIQGADLYVLLLAVCSERGRRPVPSRACSCCSRPKNPGKRFFFL